MNGAHYLDDVLLELRKLRRLADRALAQIPEQALFETLGEESNSIAVVMKHLAGNMRSRWSDFLTTDGEKRDRQRDREFEIEDGDDAAELRRRWQSGWELTIAAISALEPADLERTVTIRGEPHSVVQAIQRQLSHYAYHVGQIVLLARHHAGGDWQSLSIPKGRSDEYEVDKEGNRYLADPPGNGVRSSG